MFTNTPGASTVRSSQVPSFRLSNFGNKDLVPPVLPLDTVLFYMVERLEYLYFHAITSLSIFLLADISSSSAPGAKGSIIVLAKLK
jgi:hypothetical protein